MSTTGFDFRTLRLAAGSHAQAGREMCVMECVAWIMGEEHSDAPACVCPAVAAAARVINDRMTQAERDELLSPLLFDFAGTRGTREHAETRAFIAADFAVRVFLPMDLEARGQHGDAAALRELPKIVNRQTALAGSKAAYAHAAVAADVAAAEAVVAAEAVADEAVAAADAAYITAAAAYAAADAFAADGARRKVMEAAVQMLRDLIAVHHASPTEYAKPASSLPCLATA